MRRSLTFTRFHLGHSDFGSPQWRRGVTEVLDGIAAGWLRIPVEEEFPFERAGAMYDRLESRGVSGKLLLRVA